MAGTQMDKNAEMGGWARVQALLLMTRSSLANPLLMLRLSVSFSLTISPPSFSHTQIYSKMLSDPEVPRNETAFSCCGV